MVRNVLIRTVLRAYPMIDMTEATNSDPYAYESFNAFFTRALRAGLRPVAPGDGLVSPVDGTLSQLGAIESGQLLQAKGHPYSIGALLADPGATKAYTGGRFACLYLAPYNYHRIHMPCDGRLVGTRYVPGALFSVNDSTARTVPGLFARNERVVCEFETPLGRLAVVMVGGDARWIDRDGLCGRNQPSGSAAWLGSVRRPRCRNAVCEGRRAGSLQHGFHGDRCDFEREPRVRARSCGRCGGPTRAKRSQRLARNDVE
jgi:hypothetical protein